MPIVDALLPEYDREIATTRKLLERLPDGRFDWKPHPKSYSLGDLATHLSNLPYWGQLTLGQSELDLGVTGRATPLHSRGDVVATFAARHDVDVETARRDVAEVLEHMIELQLIALN